MVGSADLTWADPLCAGTAVGNKSLQCFRARNVLQSAPYNVLRLMSRSCLSDWRYCNSRGYTA